MELAYLTDHHTITEVKQTEPPKGGMTVAGYTKLSGAGTSYMIRINDEKSWRRVKIVCFSNSGSIFVEVLKVRLWIRDYEIETA